MPNYQYTAIGRDGNEVKGRENADTLADLEKSLKKRRLLLLKAKELRGQSVTLTLTAALATELSQLLGNGVAMDRALQIVSEDTVDAQLAALAQNLRQIITRGEPLSRALQQAGKFDPLFVALIKVGESSGQLAATLDYLESHYQTAKSFRAEILTTLSYPIALSVMSLLSLVGLAIFVVPTFRDIFAGQETSLPLGTRLVFDFSDWLLAYGQWVLVGAVAAVVGLSTLLKASAAARYGLHHMILAAPVLRDLVARYEAAKMLQVLGLMLKSGVPLVGAMELAQQTLSNLVMRDGMGRAIQQLRKGVAIPVVLESDMPNLPKVAQRFIRLGNETGRLPENCAQAAEILHKDFAIRVKALVSILDPLIILTMGGIVGFIVASMLLAVFGLSDIK